MLVASVLRNLAQIQQQRKPRLAESEANPNASGRDVSELNAFDKLTTQIERLNNPILHRADERFLQEIGQASFRHGDQGIQAFLAGMLRHSTKSFDSAGGLSPEQIKLTDLRYPYEWFPDARSMRRRLHLHVGPTNSGKTYHALKRLEEAESGVYGSPLRLLAHEVYTRLNAKGKKCNMITGDHVIQTEGLEAYMTACTVEMVPTNVEMDVAVIDEIQMMADTERGWAWTQALLGVQAREVHLCGEERTLPLITKLAAAMGEELIVHRYERLSPLKPMSTSLDGDLRNLRKGDALVTFSTTAVHNLKNKIEKIHEKKAAIVYGSLPPEVRAEQARLFNEPSNDYDFLVATDAIGMGLNLSIRRVVFYTVMKTHQQSGRLHFIGPPAIKQIGGRAGRYRAPPSVTAIQAPASELPDGGKDRDSEPTAQSGQSLGLVTTFERTHLSRVHRAMKTDLLPIQKAAIFPPADYILRFAAYFPPLTPFQHIIKRFADASKTDSLFTLYDTKKTTRVADTIESVPGLTLSERMTFANAPVKYSVEQIRIVAQELAACVAQKREAPLPELKSFDLEILDAPEANDAEYLAALEILHLSLTLYIWLSYRFAGIMVHQKMAFHVKELVEGKIQRCLASASLMNSRAKMRAKKTSERGKSRRRPAEYKLIRDSSDQEFKRQLVETITDSPSGYIRNGRRERQSQRGLPETMSNWKTTPSSDRPRI